MWDLDPGRIEYPDTAKKFEFSTMAFGCARGLEASIRYILDIGVETICTHNRLLTDQLIAGLIKQNARILSPVNDKERSAIVAANFEGYDSTALVQKLKEQQVFISLRANTLRFSPHFYNTKDDIEITLDHIEQLIKTKK
jgi:selenocysteine lyase/cysteine desulfurase